MQNETTTKVFDPKSILWCHEEDAAKMCREAGYNMVIVKAQSKWLNNANTSHIPNRVCVHIENVFVTEILHVDPKSN